MHWISQEHLDIEAIKSKYSKDVSYGIYSSEQGWFGRHLFDFHHFVAQIKSTSKRGIFFIKK